MLRRLLGPAGCCLHVAWAAAAVQCSELAEEDACSAMQTRRGEPERHPRVETTAIKAEALDRLVERHDHASNAFGVKAGRTGVLHKVQVVEAWIESRPPEVKTLIKAVFVSWVVAGICGLVGMSWGIVRWQPPSKYISWQVLNEGGAGGGLCAIPATILLAILSIPSRVMCLSLEVRRTLCGILIFYGVIFAIMWNAGLIQPVLNQIASYVYILAFAGSLIVVVLLELVEHARYHFSGPFMALQRAYSYGDRGQATFKRMRSVPYCNLIDATAVYSLGNVAWLHAAAPWSGIIGNSGLSRRLQRTTQPPLPPCIMKQEQVEVPTPRQILEAWMRRDAQSAAGLKQKQPSQQMTCDPQADTVACGRSKTCSHARAMQAAGLSETLEGTAVLFNENLPHLASTLESSLLEHIAVGTHGQVCWSDGSIGSDELRAAHAEVTAALEEARWDIEAQRVLEVPRLREIYQNYALHVVSCPQAVLQATLAKLEGLLQHLRQICNTTELVRHCQLNTPFMFDVFIYYLLLKYGLVDAYNLGNVTSQEVFRGWPIEEGLRVHFTRLLLALESVDVGFPVTDQCACVEAYDYYTTLHALFDGSLHIGRGDLHERMLRPSSEARRIIEAASYCEEWMEKDFQRIFSSYAKFSACLPGALMENIICLQRWLLAGKVVGSLNTAEMMAISTAVWGVLRTAVHDWHRVRAESLRAHIGLDCTKQFLETLLTCSSVGPSEVNIHTICPKHSESKVAKSVYRSAASIRPVV
ncbi:unnamed protein product [Symbiodinium sp. CCMP2456]|nr:unnamed protein product [Symbiodinium sp. CCMP2456]